MDFEKLVEFEVGRQRLHVHGQRTGPVRGVQLRGVRHHIATAKPIANRAVSGYTDGVVYRVGVFRRLNEIVYRTNEWPFVILVRNPRNRVFTFFFFFLPLRRMLRTLARVKQTPRRKRRYR